MSMTNTILDSIKLFLCQETRQLLKVGSILTKIEYIVVQLCKVLATSAVYHLYINDLSCGGRTRIYVDDRPNALI